MNIELSSNKPTLQSEQRQRPSELQWQRKNKQQRLNAELKLQGELLMQPSAVPRRP